MAFTKKEITQMLDALRDRYPEAGCALVHQNTYQILISVVLSAQTTDKSVNKVTGELFAKYPSPADLAEADQQDVIDIIKTIGMYKTKSRNIIALAGELVEKHGGQVPEDYDELVKLPGVGRKTANVVLAVGFGHQRIAVDTHVFRLANRIGLVKEKDVLKTELGLMKVLQRIGGRKPITALFFTGGTAVRQEIPSAGNAP